MSCETNSKTDSKLNQDKDLESIRLNILVYEKKGMTLPDMQSVQYINIPEQPFPFLKMILIKQNI